MRYSWSKIRDATGGAGGGPGAFFERDWRVGDALGMCSPRGMPDGTFPATQAHPSESSTTGIVVVLCRGGPCLERGLT